MDNERNLYSTSQLQACRPEYIPRSINVIDLCCNYFKTNHPKLHDTLGLHKKRSVVAQL